MVEGFRHLAAVARGLELGSCGRNPARQYVLPEFGYLTPDALVRAGKSQVVIDYIESIAGGATG